MLRIADRTLKDVKILSLEVTEILNKPEAKREIDYVPQKATTKSVACFFEAIPVI